MEYLAVESIEPENAFLMKSLAEFPNTAQNYVVQEPFLPIPLHFHPSLDHTAPLHEEEFPII